MIVDKFEEQVRKYSNHLAVKTGKDELTYQELNNQANVVAREIIDKCNVLAKAEREVAALLFGHGNEMIVGKMGALKAAKIYVPMDPTYPIGLLTYMLEDSTASLIITNDEFVDLANQLIQEANLKVEIINISKIKATGFQEFINPKCAGNEIAYILYTSGSTGKPKGVMQSHRNVLHFAKCYQKAINITAADRMTLLSSFSHDAGIGDIYAALLNGATLHPLDVKSNLSMNEIAKYLKAEQISIWYSVPTLYRYFINTINESDYFPTLRFIILGGESVLPNDIKQYRKTFPTASFAIMYGQSESSINSFKIYTPDCQIGKVTLGEPVAETEIVVVNERREEVAPLRIGEIVILSDYVALGYWRNEEKSQEVFRDIPGVGRTYWTGDLGKLLLDGSIEFMGRKDFQVKIRGFRIELNGIENQLWEHRAIKEAVVIAREETGEREGVHDDALAEKYLCAYIVTDGEITVNELREHLRRNLPEYMIPSHFIQLQKMPLTPSGKVDRKALPESGGARAKYMAPRNKVEEVLVQIWCEVLRCEKIGINDDFFEMGGHSLRAATLINKINIQFDINLPLFELYTNPSIASIASYICEVKNEFGNVPCVSLLKKGKNGSKNFFIIHAGQGKAAVYLKLVNHLANEFNYWGISYEESAFYDPYVMPLEKLAARYIEKIKRIQEKGPYYISGWCVGGVISFEVAKQLESAGDKVEFVGMYNSPVAGRKTLLSFFAKTKIKIRTEHHLLRKLFPEYNFFEKYKNITSFVNLWELVTGDLERVAINDESVKTRVYNQICLEAPSIKRVIKNDKIIEISDILHYFNSLRLLRNVLFQYKPKGRINAPINYFVAAKEEFKGKMLWHKYSEKKIEFHHVDVDHYTMFVDDNDVKKLAFALTSVLDSLN